ncbi:MAG TPA: VOC family protein [Microthrixaceae bacterium]|nr:VOC family protein [Microthrixaceae bacterium]
MPQRDEAPLGAPCWIELFTSKPDVTKSFYSELFGWTVEEMGPDYGNYFNFNKDGLRIAGGMANDGTAGAPDFWTTYLAVDDADKVAESAPAHGGMTMMPPMEVMTLGTMVMIGDPGGAAIGGWQPGEHKGFQVWAESGTPCWFELHTTEYDKSVDFYREVFGWPVHTMSDDSEFRYSTHGADENQTAGIMDRGDMTEPSHWAIYFGCDSTDASLEKVVALRGSIVEAAQDTPYGRIAVASDPTGVQFRLVQD